MGWKQVGRLFGTLWGKSCFFSILLHENPRICKLGIHKAHYEWHEFNISRHFIIVVHQILAFRPLSFRSRRKISKRDTFVWTISQQTLHRSETSGFLFKIYVFFWDGTCPIQVRQCSSLYALAELAANASTTEESAWTEMESNVEKEQLGRVKGNPPPQILWTWKWTEPPSGRGDSELGGFLISGSCA